jgi:hypothetical protein
MLQTPATNTLKLVSGVVYINPYASPEAIKRIRRFVKGHARGPYRWGNLYRYPMIEFQDVDDLTVVRQKFVRLIDGYKDLSDCPELPD